MSRNRWLFGILGLTLVAMLVALGAAMRSTAIASPLLQVTPTATQVITSTATITATTIVTTTPTETVTPTTTPTPGPVGRPFWSFAVKFVCGEQPADQAGQPIPGEPAVKPGNYATEINIHNPHYVGPVQIRRKALLLVDHGSPVARAPQTAAPQAFSPLFALPDDGATMEDCNSIWALLNPGTPPPSPLPLTIGYLVIVSPANLDVVAVTTATTSTTNLEPAGIAVETVAVEGKHVLIPATAFPDGVLPRDQEFTNE